jgi:hypothetical protein
MCYSSCVQTRMYHWHISIPKDLSTREPAQTLRYATDMCTCTLGSINARGCAGAGVYVWAITYTVGGVHRMLVPLCAVLTEGVLLLDSQCTHKPVLYTHLHSMESKPTPPLLAPLKALTLAQPGSNLGDSHTRSHQACWRSHSCKGCHGWHTHPHPGSPQGPG